MATHERARCRPPPTSWSSSAPRACATASARSSSVAQDTQVNPETVDEADVFALHAEGGQACVQVFFFRAGQNWGNRAYFPRVDTQRRRRRDHGRLPRPVLRGRPIPRLILVSHRARRRASCCAEAFCLKAGRKVRDRPAAARREARTGRPRPDQRPRGAGPARWPRARPSRGCWPAVCGDLRPGGPPGADRGLRQLPHHGHQRRRRHDRGRAGGLPEEPVPQVQHQEHRAHPGRRLRDDARGAAPALRAPGQGGGGGREPAAAGPGADRRRRRPAGGGAGGDGRPGRGGHRRWWASPRVRTATPGWSGSSCPARRRSCSSPRARCSTTCSACATRPTASPSAPTGPGARPRCAGTRWTRSTASGRPARRRCSTPSARPAASPAPRSSDLAKVDGVSEPLAQRIHDYFRKA